MCKKLSILLLAIAGISLLQAQTTTDFPKMEFGVQGGPGGSVFFNERPMLNPRNSKRPIYNGGMAGAGFQYNFTKMAALRVEANYEQKGDVYYSIYGYDNANTFRESYAFDRTRNINIPVTARLSFGRNVRFFVNAGMYAGVQVYSQRIISDVTYTPVIDVVLRDRTSARNITKDVTRGDAGVVAGLGVFLPVGSRAAFTIEARNNTGFINQNAGTGLYQNKFYNTNTMLLMGLTFALDKPFPKLERRYKKVKQEPVRETEQRY